ncbi:hypothetical protein BESB_011340 [Besnoitia besnoiti]|uniref:Transmembrane protein n=1 Tax=Besnoitia besnoiti TaxID=94643 RepID=A0A2A9MR36_BESBE|nr:hypothetical protein BESB_011340 [Besnoitia besnoiti]PFH38792.1 hypothetical protein BESB_011340 [Besnoitia besnoiti]
MASGRGCSPLVLCALVLLVAGACFFSFLGFLFLCSADTLPLSAATKRTACIAALSAALLHLLVLFAMLFLRSKPKGWLRERLSAHPAGRAFFLFLDDFSSRLLPRGGRERREEEDRDRGSGSQASECDLSAQTYFGGRAHLNQQTFRTNRGKRDNLRDERDALLTARDEDIRARDALLRPWADSGSGEPGDPLEKRNPAVGAAASSFDFQLPLGDVALSKQAAASIADTQLLSPCSTASFSSEQARAFAASSPSSFSSLSDPLSPTHACLSGSASGSAEGDALAAKTRGRGDVPLTVGCGALPAGASLLAEERRDAPPQVELLSW